MATRGEATNSDFSSWRFLTYVYWVKKSTRLSLGFWLCRCTAPRAIVPRQHGLYFNITFIEVQTAVPLPMEPASERIFFVFAAYMITWPSGPSGLLCIGFTEEEFKTSASGLWY